MNIASRTVLWLGVFIGIGCASPYQIPNANLAEVPAPGNTQIAPKYVKQMSYHPEITDVAFTVVYAEAPINSSDAHALKFWTDTLESVGFPKVMSTKRYVKRLHTLGLGIAAQTPFDTLNHPGFVGVSFS